MEFNIGDSVALYGNFISPYVIIDKRYFFTKSSYDNKETIYKLSKCGEAWYSEKCLESYEKYNLDVKTVQEKCQLCKRYGKPNIINDCCMGFPEYAEPNTIVYGRYCRICVVFIENR